MDRVHGPFTVDDEGRHTIQYRSTDNEGNTETPKSVSVKIDPNAPTTTALLNGEAPASNYDGPVEVDLNADDGDGSGVRLTEIRVDGGEWQPYVEEEVDPQLGGRPRAVGRRPGPAGSTGD